jgi:hypothetical protein
MLGSSWEMASRTSMKSTHALLVLSALAASIQAGPVLGPRDSVPDGYVAKPYYPTPHGGWASDWSVSYAKAQALVGQMTLAEKTNITAGTGIYMGE